eukprot:g4651.t1
MRESPDTMSSPPSSSSGASGAPPVVDVSKQLLPLPSLSPQPQSAAAAPPAPSSAATAAAGEGGAAATVGGTDPTFEGFEGPEKTLEVDLVRGVGPPRGMREVTREQWTALLSLAQCVILSHIENEHIDSYVLSESSLFVFSHKVVLKTCGTTTLLRCVPELLALLRGLGMEVEWFNYSRKNFTYPHFQLSPHTGFDAEVHFLRQHFAQGDAFVLGPLTADHWFVFDYDATNTAGALQRSEECTLDMMMFDIDEECAASFYRKQQGSRAGDDAGADADAQARALALSSGIGSLFPGAKLDAALFDPCGFSLNGLLFDSYFTVHVTPEAQCSYASFETTTCLSSYDSLINNVLRIFRPKRFVMTLFLDDGARRKIRDQPFARQAFSVPSCGTYKRKGHSVSNFEAGHGCEMCNWVLLEGQEGEEVKRERKQTMG